MEFWKLCLCFLLGAIVYNEILVPSVRFVVRKMIGGDE